MTVCKLENSFIYIQIYHKTDLLSYAAAYFLYLVYPTFMWWYVPILQKLPEMFCHKNEGKLQLSAIPGKQ